MIQWLKISRYNEKKQKFSNAKKNGIQHEQKKLKVTAANNRRSLYKKELLKPTLVK